MLARMNTPLLGMYVHQHWAYKHPYAARTWSIEDWRGYADGLRRIGFNAIMIWPMLEIMPDPLTESDQESIARIAAVIDMLHGLSMRAYVVLTPNVAPRDVEASRYTFADRPFFYCDRRVDPADPSALAALLERRERLLRPLAGMDGLSIIDSDPGGYPGSTNLEFVYLLQAHRGLLDRLRQGIELSYWCFSGWEAYCRYYATGQFMYGPDSESADCIRLLERQAPEPWSLMGPRRDLAYEIGLADRMISFPYGVIEIEPSFPLTNYGGTAAQDAGKSISPRGVMGNAQTHCLQLPNTFAFIRGARGLPVAESDYVRFAEDLLPGSGARVAECWKALAGEETERMEELAAELKLMGTRPLSTGPLRGLLFGDGSRFLADLAAQLAMKAALLRLRREAVREPRDAESTMAALGAFAETASLWQKKHGYANYWPWPLMQETLGKLDDPTVNAELRKGYDGEGETPFERVKNGYAQVETYSTRLLEAMRKVSRR
jgi:hypothetical protein